MAITLSSSENVCFIFNLYVTWFADQVKIKLMTYAFLHTASYCNIFLKMSTTMWLSFMQEITVAAYAGWTSALALFI
jgi:hypothetical protein